MLESDQVEPPKDALAAKEISMGKVIHLSPPELFVVPDNMKELVGEDVSQRQIRAVFADDYFDLMMEDLLKRFPDKKGLGIRAVLGVTTDQDLKAEALSRRRPIRSIKNILESGSDIEGNKTRVTIPGKKYSEDALHTDMSKYYACVAVEGAINSGAAECRPVILIYDLDQAKPDGEYDVDFPDDETKQNSLLAVYILDTTPLISQNEMES
jgi:hypothetical protein